MTTAQGRERNWLGAVPESWELRRLKFMAHIRNGRDQKEVLDDDGQYIVYGSGGAFGRATQFLYDKPSVLLGRKGTIDKPLFVDEPFWTVDTMFYTEIAGDVYPKYFYYLATVIPFDQFRDLTTLPSMTQTGLASVPLVCPGLDEQQRIARYLDSKTDKIDALIAKKRALIKKLKEKRLAVITHAVTKGLDSKAPLRDSGVPWIGRIPSSWDCANLRRFAAMKTGHTPSRSEASYWQDCEIPWFGLVDVWQLRDGTRMFLGETKEQISALGLANSAAELLPAGTVVLSRTASVGFSGIMPVPMTTTQDFWNWVPEHRLLPEYLLFLFRAMAQEFESLTMGSTHKTIYQSDAASLRVCVPSAPEQRAIVAHIIKVTKAIDEMVAKVELAIARLIEYRSAQITAAVTGKFDVRRTSIPAAT